MEKHITIIAVLYIVFNALALLIGCVVLAVLVGGGLLSGEQEAMVATTSVGLFVVCFLLVLSLPGIIGGWGLLNRKSWARILVIVLSILNLLNFPLGTAVGVYSLWVLFNQETVEMFS